jgi:hypothetical protein
MIVSILLRFFFINLPPRISHSEGGTMKQELHGLAGPTYISARTPSLARV